MQKNEAPDLQRTEQYNHIVIFYINKHNTTYHFPLEFLHQ
jgi:hypothetical protein